MTGTSLQELNSSFQIVDPKTGTPTFAFLEYLRQRGGFITSQEAAIAGLLGSTIEAGAGLTGGGALQDQPLSFAVGQGTGITVNADDVAIDTTAEAERIRDVIGAALVQGANVTITVDDVGETITIAATGGGGGGSTGTGGGNLAYVGSATVAGSAATTLTLSGLDLDNDGRYLIEFIGKNATTSAANLSLYYNSDTTATNYNRQTMTAANTTLSGSRANDGIISSLDSNSGGVGAGNTTFRGWLTKSGDGYPSITVTNEHLGNSAMFTQNLTHQWRTTGTNVTGITISSSVASSLAVGTTIRVWKLQTLGGGGNAGLWQLAAAVPVTTAVASVDVTGLAGATDILVITRNLTRSASAADILYVSTNNGASFYNTSGDYIAVTEGAGTEASTTGIGMFTTNTTGARSSSAFIYGANVTGAPRLIMGNGQTTTQQRLFVADTTNPINAVRIAPNTGNLTAGTVYVFKKVLTSSWTLLGSKDFGAGAASSFEVDVTGYTDIMISGDVLVHAASVQRCVQVSVNAGSSWFTTSGDYQDVSTAGVGANNVALFGHSTATTSARNFLMQIMGNTGRTPVDVYVQTRGVQQAFRGSATKINRVRLVGITSGTTVSASNFTAGTVSIFGR